MRISKGHSRDRSGGRNIRFWSSSEGRYRVKELGLRLELRLKLRLELRLGLRLGSKFWVKVRVKCRVKVRGKDRIEVRVKVLFRDMDLARTNLLLFR